MFRPVFRRVLGHVAGFGHMGAAAGNARIPGLAGSVGTRTGSGASSCLAATPCPLPRGRKDWLISSVTAVLAPSLWSCSMRRRSRLILLSAQRKQALKSRRRFSMRARTSRMICPKPPAGSAVPIHACPPAEFCRMPGELLIGEAVARGYPPAALYLRNDETVTTEVCAFNYFSVFMKDHPEVDAHVWLFDGAGRPAGYFHRELGVNGSIAIADCRSCVRAFRERSRWRWSRSTRPSFVPDAR